MIPFAGTPDASPASPVILSSLSPSEVRSIRVIGSRTGAHRGRLEALPDGAGTEFVPRRRFAPGELVRVSVAVDSPARTASGATRPMRLGSVFQVALAGASPRPPSEGPPRAGVAVATETRSDKFHSEPRLHPPAVSVSSDPDTGSGDIFLTPAHSSQKGPMILNSQGQLVWFHRVRHAVAFNLEVQSYKGQPVLTWWQGRYDQGGVDVIMGPSYHTVARLRAQGYQTDPHDFQLTPRGTAWLVARTTASANLSSVGGPSNGYVWDNVIQEVDIATGKLLWEWHAYGHIPVAASHKSPSKSFCDCYHLNSVQPLPDGNLLISSRSTWSVYKVSVKTGHILWTLGGKYNQFKMGPGTRFEWQHDAHKVGNTLTLFDDAAQPQEEGQSSAKVLRINASARTANLVARYTHQPPLLSPAQGSTQMLPNGDVFVGWGSEPDFSEYSSDGRQIFTGSFALGTTSYRAYRFAWTGQPATRPAMAVARAPDRGATVWASWNGATEVASWRVLGGDTPAQLQALSTRPWAGFETELPLSSRPRYVEVQALSSQGKVLGTSARRTLG